MKEQDGKESDDRFNPKDDRKKKEKRIYYSRHYITAENVPKEKKKAVATGNKAPRLAP